MADDRQHAMQEKYMQLQLFEQQLKQLQKNIQVLEQQLTELGGVHEGLDEAGKLKPGSEMLTAFANGIFLKTTLKDTDELIVNVGANIAVPKSVAETKQLIEKQKKEITELKEKLRQDLEKMALQASVVESDLQKLATEIKQAK